MVSASLQHVTSLGSQCARPVPNNASYMPRNLALTWQYLAWMWPFLLAPCRGPGVTPSSNGVGLPRLSSDVMQCRARCSEKRKQVRHLSLASAGIKAGDEQTCAWFSVFCSVAIVQLRPVHKEVQRMAHVHPQPRRTSSALPEGPRTGVRGPCELSIGAGARQPIGDSTSRVTRSSSSRRYKLPFW